ncbi:MAG: hypothetical protein Q9219_002451 [cf. Caloplaca sp. 3 TL-2023]
MDSVDQDQSVSDQSTPENYTMMEAFEWYVPADQKHWERLRRAVAGLKATGIDNLWIPPGCKGSSQQGNGYDIYDLYDLGEFDQKGGVSTKWGTKEELVHLVETAKNVGVGIYWDAVLNQKAGADCTERCQVVEVDANDRTRAITDPYSIDGWLGFNFPGRCDRYSTQKYHWYHFTGTDYNDANKRVAIYRILGEGKNWSNFVDKEKGNYDYLMFADIDYNHPEVEADVKAWGEWLYSQVPIMGIRFDAIKHFSEEFLESFVEHLDTRVGPGWFLVGEFWKDSREAMTTYIRNMKHKFSLFDVPLVYNFSELSNTVDADLTKVFADTLVQSEPVNAARTHPDLTIDGHGLRSWCEAYLSGTRHTPEVSANKCGIINEALAFSAVQAAVTGDPQYITMLETHALSIAKEPHGSDEWLYGRAGFLYLLRLVRHWVPNSKAVIDTYIIQLGSRIVIDGPHWIWHGKEYLGAVHGSIGIITQLLLSHVDYANHPKIVNVMHDLLQLQDPETGNFPSSMNSERDHLVQFCHGAPGFALSLPLIQQYFDQTTQMQITTALEKARECIWKRGLLTKEPNLCHGITANGLALTSPQRENFMAYTSASMIKRGKEEGWYLPGSDPFGLFCGEAGRAWGWAVLNAGKEMGIIGYSDV